MSCQSLLRSKRLHGRSLQCAPWQETLGRLGYVDYMKIPFFKVSIIFLIIAVIIHVAWTYQVDLFHDVMGMEKSYPYIIGVYGFAIASIICCFIGYIKFVKEQRTIK